MDAWQVIFERDIQDNSKENIQFILYNIVLITVFILGLVSILK